MGGFYDFWLRNTLGFGGVVRVMWNDVPVLLTFE